MNKKKQTKLKTELSKNLGPWPPQAPLLKCTCVKLYMFRNYFFFNENIDA